MVEILRENPLLLLFIVAGIGYPLGRIRFGGVSLGVAAVLFVGLGVGALDPEWRLPEIIYLLGLVLFVYTIGLSSGPSFVRSLRGKGLRNALFIVGMLGVAAGITFGAALLFGFPGASAAGLFAGSLTNTPALAGVLDYLQHSVEGGQDNPLLALPVIAYSLAYPVSVLGMILVIYGLQRLWHPDYEREARQLGAAGAHLVNRTIRVTRDVEGNAPIRDLVRREHWDVLFGRVRHNGGVALACDRTSLAPGDVVSVIGRQEEVERVTSALGEATDEHLELDRREFDYRRIFVSNPAVVGRPLRDLHLPREHGAVITRVRRGDSELLPHGDMVLELGDRVRVVTRREHMDEMTHFFGDSYRALSEIDFVSFSLGLALGLLIGLIPIPLPGGVTLRLGFAGGPLVVAIMLGALERTGPLVWNLPYSANLMLRQVGLILFLAGVGTRSGYAFVQTVASGEGLTLLVSSLAIVMTVGLLTLWIGYRVLRIPFGLLIGMLAALQTQPAVLGFALEQTDNELPNTGYAMIFPIATILKIILAQVILIVLGT